MNANQDCILICWQCRDTCIKTLYTHCLYEGGKHVEPEHVKLMNDCIEICQLAADFMTRQSSLHVVVCASCADVCEACARSCEAVGGNHMQGCAEICRRCAESCREMSITRKVA